MPFGPYIDFNDCVAKNGDKTSPEGFCAWLEHKISGSWPGQMKNRYPEAFLEAYDAALVGGKTDSESWSAGIAAAEAAGYEMARFGLVKAYQAPEMKDIANVDIFAAGTWTDSAGVEKTWTIEELDEMVNAFKNGVPVKVPLKCGHTSDEFNRKVAEALGVPVDVMIGEEGQGQISIGNMTALGRRGDILTAAFSNVPEAISDLIEGGLYSTVSVEIEDKVDDYGPVITGVALLGAENPAVNKATLERALVFGGARNGARVLTFSKGTDLPDPATLRSEFEDIRNKVADIIKGKKGAPLFRALFGNMTDLFERMIGGNHSAGDDRADKKKHQEGGKLSMDELKKIAAALGLPEEATIDDIIAAIAAMVEKLKPPEEPPVEGDMKKKEGDHSDDDNKDQIDPAVAALQNTIKDLTDRVNNLSATNTAREWEARTRSFTSLPGKPEDHAAELAKIESSAGKEVAENVFKAKEAANKAAESATEILGTSRKGEPTDFDNEVQKYMKEHADPEKTEAELKSEAIKYVSRTNPTLYINRS